MASKTVGIMLVTAVTAGCATSGSNSWEPSRLAPDPHIYAGASIGSATYDDDQQARDATIQSAFTDFGLTVSNFSSSTDDSDLGYGAVLGYRFSSFFATEIAYLDLGKFKYNASLNASGGVLGPQVVPSTVDLNVNVDGVGVSLLGFLPLTEEWELYARGGLLFSNTEVRSNFNLGGQENPGDFAGNSEDLFASLGASYRWGEAYTFRLEYQRYMDVGNDDTGETDVDFVGLQVMYSIF